MESLEEQALEQECNNLVIEISQLINGLGVDDFKAIDLKSTQKDLSVDFIKSASDLRADVYSIKKSSLSTFEELLGVKNLSYKTTTAAIAGAIGMELVKLLLDESKCNNKDYLDQQIKDTSRFRNTFLNLESFHFVYSQPKQAKAIVDVEYDPIYMGPVKAIPSSFTVWDYIEIRESITIAKLMKKLKDDFHVNIVIVSLSSIALYNFYSPQNRHLDRLDTTIEDLIVRLKGPILSTMVELDVGAETIEEQVDVNMPKIKYVFA